MDREQVISKLREYEPELKAAGITHLSVFGSVARDDANPESDVDLMAEFDGSKSFTILGRVHLENRIADMLGVKVDLSHAAMLRDGIRERASREAVLVF